MPRAVRNFWIEANIDGYKNPLKGGPRNKDGGFVLFVGMRDQGSVTNPVYIRGMVTAENKLALYVHANGKIIYEMETER